MSHHILLFTGIYQMKYHTRKRSYTRETGHKFELKHKEHIRYITSSNPEPAQANHILSSTHVYGTIETTMMLLQSAH